MFLGFCVRVSPGEHSINRGGAPRPFREEPAFFEALGLDLKSGAVVVEIAEGMARLDGKVVCSRGIARNARIQLIHRGLDARVGSPGRADVGRKSAPAVRQLFQGAHGAACLQALGKRGKDAQIHVILARRLDNRGAHMANLPGTALSVHPAVPRENRRGTAVVPRNRRKAKPRRAPRDGIGIRRHGTPGFRKGLAEFPLAFKLLRRNVLGEFGAPGVLRRKNLHDIAKTRSILLKSPKHFQTPTPTTYRLPFGCGRTFRTKSTFSTLGTAPKIPWQHRTCPDIPGSDTTSPCRDGALDSQPAWGPGHPKPSENAVPRVRNNNMLGLGVCDGI